MPPLTIALIVVALQLLLLVLSFLFLVRAIVQIVSDRSGVPFVRTPHKVFHTIAEALVLRPGETVYELGSGDGGFTLWCAAHYPEARFIGIELNPILVAYSRYFQRRRGLTNVEFVKGDVLKADYTHANKIFAYMLPTLLNKLLPKLTAEFRGRLASRAFQFKEKTSAATIALPQKKGWHGEHILHLYEF